jgi:hypothetical protein
VSLQDLNKDSVMNTIINIVPFGDDQSTRRKYHSEVQVRRKRTFIGVVRLTVKEGC